MTHVVEKVAYPSRPFGSLPPHACVVQKVVLLISSLRTHDVLSKISGQVRLPLAEIEQRAKELQEKYHIKVLWAS